MIEFPNITEAPCPLEDGVLPEQPDDACDVAAFALANPGLCPVSNRLILAPERAGACVDSPSAILFKTFLSGASMTEITSGVTYASSDPTVLAVNATTGEAAPLAAGVATVTATYTTYTATATVTVLAGEGCCALMTTTNLLLVDNSDSMGRVFDGQYPNLLSLAKAMAAGYVAALGEADTSLYYSFNETASLRSTLGEIGLTTAKTNLKTAVESALAVLAGATTERKVLVIFSDGDNRPVLSLADQEALVTACMDFKVNGGLIICIGLRASGDGYSLLKLLTSGGFFINVVDEPATAITQMNVLRSLLCLPACLVDGTVNIVPTMTGASSPSGAASATSDDGFNLPWMAFDGDVDTVWNSSTGQTLPQSLIYEFDQARSIFAYGVRGSGVITTPTGWTLEGSSNGSAWTAIDTQSGSFAHGELHRFELDEAVTYKYYRLRVTATASPSDWTSVAALELYSCRLGVFGAQVADPDPLAEVE